MFSTNYHRPNYIVHVSNKFFSPNIFNPRLVKSTDGGPVDVESTDTES